jgi:dolichyldiphosphatase
MAAARAPRAAATARAASAAAAAEPPPPPSAVQPPPSRLRTALVLVNEGTKFGVSALAFGTLLYFRNAHAAFALFGSILNALAGKLLKRLLKHARPPGARKADPGMPSSHGVSLGYLATYGAVALLAHPPGDWAPLAAAALEAAGLFLAALRVALGYHTAPQVVVGFAMGAVNAVALHALCVGYALPALAAAPAARGTLYAATGAAIAVFAAQGAASWVADARHVLALHSAQRSAGAPA